MNEPAFRVRCSLLKFLCLRLLCLTVALSLVLPALAQSESGLVGHWKLEENDQGNVIADASPNELHGVFSEATVGHSVEGKIGRAVRFSGMGSIQLDKHAPVLGKLTDFTVSMWIQYDGGGSRMLFSFSDGTLSHRPGRGE